LARRQFLSTFLERCETGVEVAPNCDELRLALGEAAFDLGSALHRRREAFLQLRQLPLTCDRGLRHHLLEPADHRLPLAARLPKPRKLLFEQRLKLVGEAAECCSPVLQLREPLRVARDLRERPLVHVRMVIGVQEQPPVRAALEGAKARLDRLQLYPAPVRIDRVRVHVWPRLFRLPWFNRFHGYAAWCTILLPDPAESAAPAPISHAPAHAW